MVFIGGWRPRRRGFGAYGPGYGGPMGYGPPPGYRRGYGGGGSSCMRDMCLVESGCCLADLMGCGPQLALVGPSLIRRSVTAAATGSEPAAGRGVRAWLLRFVLAAIAVYQRDISPKRRACCRFSPTCSHYAAQALRDHGLRRGLWLSARRLLRCRPGATGGDDPVPSPR
ncbi:membrane protein insertion efficiency factor YidD [Jatrophihabitans lederbergiae]|uniref:Putative membrane protein insertion efficiency factor n=1 Tax=Jatrophihabitans lederbergiae TaxID=3075547 RepID=A0ABU2J6J6_9ACTN|nr:membrane protein insertion efficiency factor YidD [Jatrophihabitans sp. DSM 44399]MDT0260620.1 membrane protein insertion efficiency factor YidD [Jatrophihabitans sp. DSM 44399]